MKTQKQKLISIIKKSELDNHLAQYIDICDQIKIHEIEKDRLKRILVKSYFESNPTYSSKDGSIIASYMSQARTQFKNTDFKDDHPDLYEEFSYAQEVYIFNVKRGMQS